MKAPSPFQVEGVRVTNEMVRSSVVPSLRRDLGYIDRLRSNFVSHEFVAAKILRERGAVASNAAAGGVEDEYNDRTSNRSTL